jgi:hypothetical protein
MRPLVFITIIFAIVLSGCNALSGIEDFTVGHANNTPYSADGAVIDDGAVALDTAVEPALDTGTSDSSLVDSGSSLDSTPATDTAPTPPDGSPPCSLPHSNGLGTIYWSCEPIGNWPALIWQVEASFPEPESSHATTSCPIAGIEANCVTRSGASLATKPGEVWNAYEIVWCWSGAGVAGHVRLTRPTKPASVPGEYCPTSSDPGWD